MWENVTSANLKPMIVACNKFYRTICGALQKSSSLSAIHESSVLPITLRLKQIAMNQAQSFHYNHHVYHTQMIYIPPWTKRLSQMTIILQPTKLEAFQYHDTFLQDHQPDWALYTDGSVMDQHLSIQRVGCGFYWVNLLQSRTYQEFFRLIGEATIYDAEWMALIKGLLYVLLDASWTTGVFFTDSKSVLSHWKNIQLNNLPFFEGILSSINDQLVHQGRKITFIWIPSHQGIEGNEIADKLAAQGALSESLPLLQPLMTKDALKSANKAHIQDLWRQQWRTAPQTNGRSLVQSLSSPDFTIHRIHQSLSASASRWLTWCRTNYLPLNHFLAIRTPSVSPKCPTCDAEDETLDHFLFECPTYTNIRHSTLHPFLSRNYNPTQPNPLFQLLLDDTGRYNLIQYIAQTKRFGAPNL